MPAGSRWLKEICSRRALIPVNITPATSTDGKTVERVSEDRGKRPRRLTDETRGNKNLKKKKNTCAGYARALLFRRRIVATD
jgi:hypothetical protein